MRHDAGDHSEPKCLCGIEFTCGEHQIARSCNADVSGQYGGIGRVRDSSQKFGNAECGPIAGDGDVGHHRNKEAAGLTDSVDRGNHRRATVTDGHERDDVVARKPLRHIVSRIGASTEIAAGRKYVVDAGDDQCSQIRI